MSKMGWKSGQGLGKDEQGIQNPIVARKIDKNQAIIEMATTSSPLVSSVVSSPVIVLTNLVGGPDEVDEDLEGSLFSTRFECSFYIFSTRFECSFASSPLVSSVVFRRVS
jgi:hypothetical protein